MVDADRPDVVSREHGAAKETVQRAVERFVELHTAGKAPDPLAFAQDYDESLRGEILLQCREFLTFDGLFGAQEWQDDEPEQDEGRTFGDFLIQEELGRGGMGVVYLARERSLDRTVALKVMASGLTLSKRHVERFRREAMATAQLRHPAIVPVHRLVEVDGTYALAMDYVAGRNLADVLDDLRLLNGEGEGVHTGTLGIAKEKGYVAECALLAAQVASALAAAHQNHIVHRDLKPRNLMIDDRRQVRLLDFGLAKSLDESRESLSMSGEITGTAHYMSPEQTLAKRVDVDHRADIWSLGVILYELLTLRRPFDGKNLQQVVYEICFKEPVPLHKRNPKVPRDLVTICNKALEKDPQNRYQTAAELEADLQRFLSWEPIHARPASAWTRASKFVRRHRKESIAVALLVVAAIAVWGVLWAKSVANDRRADELLHTAERHAQAGDYAAAIELCSEALGLRNDDAARERLDRYHAEQGRVASDVAWKVAESKQLLEHDREGALLLALAAEQQLPSAKTRSAVLDALGSGQALHTLPTPADRRVVTATWSPSGGRIAVGGYGGTLQVFGANRLDEPRLLRSNADAPPIIGLAFAGENTLVSASPDGALQFWNLDRDPCTPRLLALDGLTAAALRSSRSGHRILVVAYNAQERRHSARVFDTATRTALTAPVAHRSYVLAAALSESGVLAASCADGRTIRLWHSDDLQTLRELKAEDGVRSLAFSPDDALLAAASTEGAIQVFDTASGRLLATARHSAAVLSLAFDSSGRRLLSGSRDRTARLWALTQNGDDWQMREAGVLVGHRGDVQAVAFGPHDQLAVTVTKRPGGAIRLFDVTAGRTPDSQAVHTYAVGESLKSASFSADGRRILAVTSRRVLVWDFSSELGVVTLRQPGRVPAIAFADRDRQLITAGDDERVRCWHVQSGNQAWTTEQLGNPILALAVDDARRRVACSLVGGGAKVLSTTDGSEQATIPAAVCEAVFVDFLDRDHVLLAGRNPTAGERGIAVIYDLAAERLVQTLDRPEAIHAADLSPDGSLLLTVEGKHHHAHSWTVPDFAAGDDRAVHAGPLRSVRFASDGRRIVSTGADGVVQISMLDGRDGLRLFPRGRVAFATFSPDGRFVLTCSVGGDAAAQLWRVDDGSEVLHFDGHRGALIGGALTADGAWAATCAQDGTTCIWPTDPVAIARRLPLRKATQSRPPDPR